MEVHVAVVEHCVAFVEFNVDVLELYVTLLEVHVAVVEHCVQGPD